MKMETRSQRYFDQIVQVFSVSIQLKDQRMFGFPIRLALGDTATSLPNQASLQKLLNNPLQRCSNHDKSVKLYGTIKILTGGIYETILFNQDKQTPRVICSGDTLPLICSSETCPPCLGFCLHTDLYEADHGLEISHGYLYFETHLRDYTTYYDKRFSSVIHGEHDSVTVFYTMFEKAVQANVEAKLVVNGTNTFCVYGCLTVRYGGHVYKTEYDKEHYRPVLFNRPASNGIALDEGGDIFLLPLAVPRLGVPKDASSFIIEADLRVLCRGSEIATLRADTYFSLPDDFDDLDDEGPPNEGHPDCKNVGGNNCCLQLKVTWTS